jgi:hypothetical protein
MWRSYVGGLLTGVAVGGAASWLAVLSLVPAPDRDHLLVNPYFPWAALLAFALAGETLRVKARAGARPVASPYPA